MKRMYEFMCAEGHVTEQLIDEGIRTTVCKECGDSAIRILSTPRIKLEGITGAFPGAADKWVKNRAEKLKQEQKKASQE
jgi:predicted Fe-Mo cluster-binding NifX family protein